MSIYVKYIDAPQGAQEAMRASSEDGQAFGAPANLSGSAFGDVPWATLEPKSWSLDGTRRLIEDTPPDDSIGWWSRLRSDEVGVFSGGIFLPTIRLHFGQENSFSAPGITFRFWPSMGQWCSAMRVTWYYAEYGDPYPDSEANIMAQEMAFPDSANWFLEKQVDKFNFIDIEFLSTNIPGQFAKLQNIQVGCVHFFFQDELVRVSLLNEVDPSACELSADELTVEILDKKNRHLTVQENQKMQFYQNEKLIASHYIQKCTREGENKHIFKCNSAIALLEDTFLGGIYQDELLFRFEDDVSSGVLYDVLGDVPWSLDPAFAFTTISGYLPVCTRREALQQIAFAIGARITTQGDGFIHISPIDEDVMSNPVSGFDKESILSGSTLTKEICPTKIQITSHQYEKSEETETLLESAGLAADEVFVFSEPHWGYELEGDLTGVDIEEHDNWVRISVTDLATITLTGKKYVHITQEHSWTSTDALRKETSNAVKVENATLITAQNVEGAIARLKYYHSLPNLVKGTVVVGEEKAGDVVEIANPFGYDLTSGYITSMESEFTANGRTASIEIRGVDVPGINAEVLTR